MARASFKTPFSSIIFWISSIALCQSTTVVKAPLEILELPTDPQILESLTISSGQAQPLNQSGDDNNGQQVIELVRSNNTVDLNETTAAYDPLNVPQGGPEIDMNNETHVYHQVTEFATNVHDEVTDLTTKIHNDVTKFNKNINSEVAKFTANIHKEMTNLSTNLDKISWTGQDYVIKIDNNNFKWHVTVNGKPVDVPGTDLYDEIWRSVGGEELVTLFPVLSWLRPKEKDPSLQGTGPLQFISGVFRTLWYVLYVIPVLNQLVFGLLGVVTGICIFLIVIA